MKKNIKKIGKVILVGLIIVLIYKGISFITDVTVMAGKNIKKQVDTNQQEQNKDKTSDEDSDKSKDAEDETEAKPEAKLTFKERAKAPATEFAITNDYFKLYMNNDTLKTTSLKDICRNETNYIGKNIYLANMEITETKELEDEGELLVCYDKTTDGFMYLVYDYSQLKTKYVVGDKISSIGKIREVQNRKGIYIPTIDTTYVFIEDDNGYIINIYGRLGDSKYEVRPLETTVTRTMFEVYDLDTKNKLDKTIVIENGKDYYWSDINWNYSDIIPKVPAK